VARGRRTYPQGALAGHVLGTLGLPTVRALADGGQWDEYQALADAGAFWDRVGEVVDRADYDDLERDGAFRGEPVGRTGLEPLFPGRFPWFYRQRYWRRFALVFAAAWTIFVLLAASVAMLAGEKEEALFFFTPKGASVIVIFIVIFAAEGAMVGGLIDLFARFFRKS